jgi:hypothetical protein
VLLEDWLAIFWPETMVEVCIDFNLVFAGTAAEAVQCKYKNHMVEETYVDFDRKILVVSIKSTRKYVKKSKV